MSAMRMLLTGGTVDCDHIDTQGVYRFTESFIPQMLAQGRSRVNVILEKLFLKDSVYTTDEDRALVTRRAIEAPEKRIIVAHGTDTMRQTAETLGQTRALQDKTVVLFGAMKLYNGQPDSDATFNLGAALMAAQLLPNGIYIIMNGLAFDWFDVRKNLELGVFETLDGGIPADRN